MEKTYKITSNPEIYNRLSAGATRSHTMNCAVKLPFPFEVILPTYPTKTPIGERLTDSHVSGLVSRITKSVMKTTDA